MEILGDTNSRYHRQELITWWDQSKLHASRVLVVGAGALGNEVVKNLALVGVGHIEIVDMDDIEHSNLARCVFFREGDEGRLKADVLAERAKELNSDISTLSHTVPVQRLGIGALQNFDVVIGALDNREARAWVNQASRKLGKYWIDGAIEGLRGLARVFGPTGACYACTLTENDYKQMSHRKSCALLAPHEMLAGKTPTNATTASIVAGVQVQEAIKLLAGHEELLSLVGKCWVYTGDSMDTYVTRYNEDEFCLAHDVYESVEDATSLSSIEELISTFGGSVLDAVVIDFEEDVISLSPCTTCGGSEKTQLRSAIPLGGGQCANCSAELIGEMFTSLSALDARNTLSFQEIGLAENDILTIRNGEARNHYFVKGAANGKVK